MAKGLTILADMQREEHYKSLMQLSDRDMCEMIRAHFESHPTLAGEKATKDKVQYLLSRMDTNREMTEDQKVQLSQKLLSDKMDLPPELRDSDLLKPLDNDNILTQAAKENLAKNYAQTRIRETPLKEGNYYLDFRHFDPTALKCEQIALIRPSGQADVTVARVGVELQKNDIGDVYVLAEQSDGGHRTIGTLPDNFLKNNPMNVDSCEAELQIADYSNGNMKNISARVVVDTDLMSGDVLDLNDDMLAGLDQESGLEQ